MNQKGVKIWNKNAESFYHNKNLVKKVFKDYLWFSVETYGGRIILGCDNKIWW